MMNRVLWHLPKGAIPFLKTVFKQSYVGKASSQHRNTLAWYPQWSCARTPQYPLPQIYWTPVVHSLERSYSVGSSGKKTCGDFCVTSSLGSNPGTARRWTWPAFWKSQQKSCWEAANRRGFPGFGWRFRHRMGQRPPLQANPPEGSILPDEIHIIIPRLPNIIKALPVSHVYPPCHPGRCGSERTRFRCTAQPVYTTYPHRHATTSWRSTRTARLL
jgi:hypothetical protein